MRTVYIADDGKEFDDPCDCELYEGILCHKEVYGIEFYDAEGKPFHIQPGNEFDDDIYQKTEELIVHNKKELECLQWLTESCGWCEFDSITSPGRWKRFLTDEFFHNGEYRKIRNKKRVGD